MRSSAPWAWMPARLGRVQPSGTLAGVLSRELTSAFGLTRPPAVVTGGHDQACGALGVGLTTPGLASVSTGTAEVVEVALPSPVVSRPLYEGNISVYSHVVPGLFLAMTLNHSGGMSMRWFRDGFCEPQMIESAKANTDAYDLMLVGASAAPTGLLVLPHFSGSGTPTFDTASKAAILGLTFATTRADIAKAILEGLTYELRLNLDLLKAGGVQIDVLRAIGGGAKSKLWLQLKADITGIPVVTPKITEAAGFGAALLAGVGAGIFPSAAEAANRFLQLTDEYIPTRRATLRTPASSNSTGRSILPSLRLRISSSHATCRPPISKRCLRSTNSTTLLCDFGSLAWQKKDIASMPTSLEFARPVRCQWQKLWNFHCRGGGGCLPAKMAEIDAALKFIWVHKTCRKTLIALKVQSPKTGLLSEMAATRLDQITRSIVSN